MSSNMDAINNIKMNINRYEKEIDKYRNEFLVNKTKYNQYMEDRKALLSEIESKGYTIDDLNNTLSECYEEMNSIESQIKELLYTDKFNIKADIEIEETKDIEIKDAEKVDFNEVDLDSIPEIDLELGDKDIDWDSISKSMS